MKREYIYIGIIVLLVIMVFGSNFEIKRKTPEKTTIDSTLVVKEVPKKMGGFRSEKPQPIVVVVPSQNQPNNDTYINSLLSELKSIKETDKQQSKLLKELALRVYEKTYQDSTVIITVKDSVNGHLQSQNVQWTVKPQKIKYYEKTITEKVTPKFSLLLGGKMTTSNTFEKSAFELNAGFQFKNGNILEAGYDTNNRFSVGFKKNIFRKY